MAATREYSDFWEGLKELDRFYQENDIVFKTMRRLARRLEKAEIPYAVVGGMAVFAHKHRRATNDVDILLTPQGFTEFREQFVPKKYEPLPGRDRRFTDRKNGVMIDILVTGRFPGSGKPGPFAYPDPANVSEPIKKVRIVDLPTLIQLKLAARRHQDFADVVALIRQNGLDESFSEQLHRSVHNDYIECLEEKRREDEYEAQNG